MSTKVQRLKDSRYIMSRIMEAMRKGIAEIDNNLKEEMSAEATYKQGWAELNPQKIQQYKNEQF